MTWTLRHRGDALSSAGPGISMKERPPAISQVTPHLRTEAEKLAWFRTMRDTSPVSRDPTTGVWNVFRY